MTAADQGPATAFVAEFRCPRHCGAEMDLDDAHARMTYGQMLGDVEAAHKAAHKQDPPVKVFTAPSGVTVRAGVL